MFDSKCEQLFHNFYFFNLSRWNWDQEIGQKVNRYRAGVFSPQFCFSSSENLVLTRRTLDRIFMCELTMKVSDLAREIIFKICISSVFYIVHVSFTSKLTYQKNVLLRFVIM